MEEDAFVDNRSCWSGNSGVDDTVHITVREEVCSALPSSLSDANVENRFSFGKEYEKNANETTRTRGGLGQRRWESSELEGQSYGSVHGYGRATFSGHVCGSGYEARTIYSPAEPDP